MKLSRSLFQCRGLVAAFAILTCLMVSNAAFAQRNRSPPSEWAWVNPDGDSGCVHGTLHSPSMNREIGFSIYLPPAYAAEPDKEFPVVYYLHGAGGSDASSKEFAWAVRGAIEKGMLQDVIYVFPNGGKYSGYRDWKDGSVMAETWIIKELIPHIDETYRTIKAREGRALTGWSMGGGGSLRFVTKYPDMFCAAATMAAAVNMTNDDPADSTLVHLEKNHEQIRGKVGFWLAVGEQDRLREGNEALVAKLKEMGIEHTFSVLPDAGHNLGKLSGEYHSEIVQMLQGCYVPARAAKD